MSKHFILFILLFSMACSQERQLSKESNSKESASLTITIDPSRTFQTIHNFGASDAWACRVVGKSWPEAKKKLIADYLFSMSMDAEGTPMGIGLSCWRFNIGAGSQEQGSASDIKDPWRRAESFMLVDGNLDWSQQQGQRWFLQAAKERGVEQFIGFVNAPPVAISRNGKAYSAGGEQGNLAEENYLVYVDFLVEVIQQLKEQDGIHLDYLSPFNEPQWDWNKPNQEGSPWTNEQIYNICRLLDEALDERRLDTKIEITEAGQLNFLYEKSTKHPARSEQIRTFFAPDSPLYLGSLKHMAPKIAGHSYFTTWPLEKLLNVRSSLWQHIQSVDPKESMSINCLN